MLRPPEAFKKSMEYTRSVRRSVHYGRDHGYMMATAWYEFDLRASRKDTRAILSTLRALRSKEAAGLGLDSGATKR